MITNKNRHPDVDFLADSEIRPIGTVGGVRLVLLGRQQGSNSMVVSRSYAPSFTPSEDFFAIILDELLSFSQDEIYIDDGTAN